MATTAMGVGTPPKRRILAEQFKNKKQLDSWDWEEEIGNGDFGELLSVVAQDVHEIPKWQLILLSVNYDTPFFDGYGRRSGTGCLNGKCYDRSELNYIGEGLLWAAVGVSKEEGHEIVELWKQKSCAPVGFHGENLCVNPAAYNQPTKEVIEMFDIGYDFYNLVYPPASTSVVGPAPGPVWP